MLPAISWDGVSWACCPGWSWTMIFLISTSQVGRITGLSQGTWPCLSLNTRKCRAGIQVPAKSLAPLTMFMGEISNI
jgi:hypothetical protein